MKYNRNLAAGKEYKTLPLQLKEGPDEKGTFTGYASTFRNAANPDSDGDVVVKGAFKRSLDHSGGKVPILFSHDPTRPAGISLEMSEDEHGLLVKGQLALGTQDGRECHEFMKLGTMRGLSIGYSVPKDGAEFKDGIRFLREVKLWEFSPVVFPADDGAGVTAVKSVTTFQDLPLAPKDKAWDKGTAEKTVRDWAGGTDNMDWAKYRKAFLCCDTENPEKFGSYTFPIAEVIDGKLMAVPHAIYAAAARVDNSSLSDDDKASVKTHLTRYYKKLGEDAPFDKAAAVPGFKAEDFNSSLAEAGALSDLYNLRWQYDSALSDAIEDIQNDDALDLDAQKAAVTTSLQQYAAAMAAWWGRYLDLTADDSDESHKAGRRISNANTQEMKAAAELAAQSMGHHAQGVKCMKSAHRKLQGLLDQAQAESGAQPEKASSHFLARLTKAGRSLSAATCDAVKDAMDYMAKSVDAHREAMKAGKTGHAKLTALLEDGNLHGEVPAETGDAAKAAADAAAAVNAEVAERSRRSAEEAAATAASALPAGVLEGAVKDLATAFRSKFSIQ